MRILKGREYAKQVREYFLPGGQPSLHFISQSSLFPPSLNLSSAVPPPHILNGNMEPDVIVHREVNVSTVLGGGSSKQDDYSYSPRMHARAPPGPRSGAPGRGVVRLKTKLKVEPTDLDMVGVVAEADLENPSSNQYMPAQNAPLLDAFSQEERERAFGDVWGDVNDSRSLANSYIHTINMFDSKLSSTPDAKGHNESFYENVGPIPFATTLNMALQSQRTIIPPTHSISATISHTLANPTTLSPRSKILESPRLRKARQQHANAVAELQAVTAPVAPPSHPNGGANSSPPTQSPIKKRIGKKLKTNKQNSLLNLHPTAQGQAWISSVLDADDPDEPLLAQVYEAGFHEIMIEKGIIEDDLHPLRPLVRFS